MLPRILRLSFTLAAEGPGTLPPYLGSLLRGALGHALRRIGCGTSCASTHRDCPYGRLFEPFAGRRQPYLAGEPVAPRPYVIEPRSAGGDVDPGDPLIFDLLLIGSARELRAAVSAAVHDLAPAGLGARRIPFRLVEAREIEPVTVPSPGAPASDRLTLRWVTPLRLMSGGRIQRKLALEDLVDRAVQRQEALAHLFGDAPAPVPGGRERWRACARELRVEHSTLRWHDLHRYSHRQRRRHPLGGLVGKMRLRGDLAPLLGVLRGMETLHVGKGTTFGLGRLELSEGGSARTPSSHEIPGRSAQRR